MSSSLSAPDPDNSTLPGSLFAGKYRIEKILGQGGMGLVLAARHVGLDEPVAIKVLLPTMMTVPGMVDRFTREARAAAKIKNDHVVRVTDVDALPSGVPYMVMERLEGSDLAIICQRLGPLPIADAVRYLLETCSAIGEAHAMGIIHRDLKPANLFLARRRDGTTAIKVLDFGISKAIASLGEHTMTVAGEILGSPNYMSPEQISALRDLDGRTDIWSLGVILYKLLTAVLPFPSRTWPPSRRRGARARRRRRSLAPGSIFAHPSIHGDAGDHQRLRHRVSGALDRPGDSHNRPRVRTSCGVLLSCRDRSRGRSQRGQR